MCTPGEWYEILKLVLDCCSRLDFPGHFQYKGEKTIQKITLTEVDTVNFHVLNGFGGFPLRCRG